VAVKKIKAENLEEERKKVLKSYNLGYRTDV
jgi:hypothetical protein